MSTTRFPARDLAHVAVFAALIIALGLPGAINIGISGVPITLQSLGVMMAGALLGARKGVLAVLTVIALGLVGLPVLAGGRTALVALSSPTAGFLIGWIPTAFLIGWLTTKMLPKYRIIPGAGINLLGGVAVLYLFGIGGMMIRGHMTFLAAWSANAAFIPLDAGKAVATALVAAQVHRAYPALLRDTVAARSKTVLAN